MIVNFKRTPHVKLIIHCFQILWLDQHRRRRRRRGGAAGRRGVGSAFLFHFEGYSVVQQLTRMCNQNIRGTKDFVNGYASSFTKTSTCCSKSMRIQYDNNMLKFFFVRKCLMFRSSLVKN